MSEWVRVGNGVSEVNGMVWGKAGDGGWELGLEDRAKGGTEGRKGA